MTNSNCLSACGLTLDAANQQVFVNGTPRHLTPMECRLLTTFIRHAGQVLSRAFLMKEVWDTDYVDDTRTLEVHVCWLRKFAVTPSHQQIPPRRIRK
jgi:two-component system alkaline phosphatase synthesis response regulator PhoP